LVSHDPFLEKKPNSNQGTWKIKKPIKQPIPLVSFAWGQQIPAIKKEGRANNAKGRGEDGPG